MHRTFSKTDKSETLNRLSHNALKSNNRKTIINDLKEGTTLEDEDIQKIIEIADMKLKGLKGKEYIHSIGQWDNYINYLRKEL